MNTNNLANDDLDVDSDLIAPKRPHDDYTFDQLAEAYNFRVTSDRRLVFSRLLQKECMNFEAPVRVLDIGCGNGIGRRMDYLRAIAQNVDEFWGIEPDASVTPDAGIFEHFQHALMETAELPENHFDLAYCFMVMEHVADPIAFMQALNRCLKPGGVFLFMTPNGGHYFTRLASLMHKLKIDEVALKILKRGDEEEYHYPVQYRFNHTKDINSCLDETGFEPAQFAFMEHRGPVSYLPGPLRPILWTMNLKRKVIRSPQSLLTLAGRTAKKVTPSS